MQGSPVQSDDRISSVFFTFCLFDVFSCIGDVDRVARVASSLQIMRDTTDLHSCCPDRTRSHTSADTEGFLPSIYLSVRWQCAVADWLASLQSVCVVCSAEVLHHRSFRRKLNRRLAIRAHRTVRTVLTATYAIRFDEAISVRCQGYVHVLCTFFEQLSQASPVDMIRQHDSSACTRNTFLRCMCCGLSIYDTQETALA